MDRTSRRNVVRDPMLRPSRAYVARATARPVRSHTSKPDVSVYRATRHAQPLQSVTTKKAVPATDVPAKKDYLAAITPSAHEDLQIQSASKAPKKSLQKLHLIFSVMAAFVFLLGIGVSIDGWRTNKVIEAQATQQNAREDETLDDAEVSPNAIRSHTVAPDAPRYIIIDKLGVKARIKAVDTKASGELEAPKNIFDVGWYRSGGKPGSSGAMLLDGHVSSPRKAGVFKNIPKLIAGDTIKVERGDGQIFIYKVIRGKSFPADNVDMKSAVTSVTPGKPGLNLITCHGKVVKGTSEFSERYIVYTEQV